MRTTCEECQSTILLDTVDADGTLIGDECECGYYVTRYMPGMDPDGEGSPDYYWPGTGELMSDPSYINYLNTY